MRSTVSLTVAINLHKRTPWPCATQSSAHCSQAVAKCHRAASVLVRYTQGINRLGAGPRKPGIARPIDPNRFIVQDLVPEGVENDQDYKRMVQDVRCGCTLQVEKFALVSLPSLSPCACADRGRAGEPGRLAVWPRRCASTRLKWHLLTHMLCFCVYLYGNA